MRHQNKPTHTMLRGRRGRGVGGREAVTERVPDGPFSFPLRVTVHTKDAWPRSSGTILQPVTH